MEDQNSHKLSGSLWDKIGKDDKEKKNIKKKKENIKHS